MIDFSAPLAGIQQAEQSLDRVSRKLAKAGSPEDQVDLSAEALAMIEAKLSVKANASMVRTQEEISRTLTDLLC